MTGSPGTVRPTIAEDAIIPDEVRMQLTLRSYRDETRKHLIDSIRRIVAAQAESAGMPEAKRPEVIVSDDQAPALYNQPELCHEVRRFCGAVLGPEKVLSREPTLRTGVTAMSAAVVGLMKR